MDDTAHDFGAASEPDDPPFPSWRALLDASAFATLIFMPDLILLHCNAAHIRTSGVPAEAMRGRFMFDVFPKNPGEEGPDTEETIRASVRRVMETLAPDEPPIQKHDLPRADGTFEPRYWRIVHSPVIENGAVVAIRQDSWDVTAFVLDAERQETLRRAAGTLAGIAFWELDVDADRITHSPEFDVLFGFPADDGTGVARPFSTYAERFHEGDQGMIEAAIADLMSEGPGGVRQFEYRIVRPDGEVRHALVRGEVATGAKGQRVLTGITFDVTDLRAREAQLAALVEEKEALLDEVNHRVKNSLQLVGAILSLEARKAAEGERDRLRSAAARVQSVAAVHASLYHGRDVCSVEMGAHLRQFCVHLAESLGAEARGIALLVDAEEIRLPAAQAVPLALIVNELVTNAFKHGFADEAPNGSRVTISLYRGTEDTYALTVADNGSGPGTEGRREDSPSNDGVQGPAAGSGLGRQLIATLVRQIGGSVVQERDGGWRTRIAFGE